MSIVDREMNITFGVTEYRLKLVAWWHLGVDL